MTTPQQLHIPVLLDDVLSLLDPQEGEKYLDLTAGYGGHARQVISRIGGAKYATLCDRDDYAISHLADLSNQGATLVHDEYLSAVCQLISDGRHFDMILLDLGVSSDQLDTPERGFSFRADGPLDMRMRNDAGETAAELLARLDVSEMAKLFRELGEERQALRVAKAIDRERRSAPITRTAQLADIVAKAVGSAHTPGRHPATRVFQALRMAVNDELGEVRRAIAGGLNLLKPGGCLAIITFESLSDRVVKESFRAHCGREESLLQGGSVWRGELPRTEWILRKAVTARPEETARNPRARSAKLRAVRKAED